MKLKDIVHDLKYGKKLKELGVKQDSLYYFDKEYESDTCYTLLYGNGYGGSSPYKLSAFTSAELLEMLPEYIENITKHLCNLNIHKYKDGYIIRYGSKLLEFKDKKPCNALAKMLIYLIENKLIKE